MDNVKQYLVGGIIQINQDVRFTFRDYVWAKNEQEAIAHIERDVAKVAHLNVELDGPPYIINEDRKAPEADGFRADTPFTL